MNAGPNKFVKISENTPDDEGAPMRRLTHGKLHSIDLSSTLNLGT
jgi:hypothetical protein